HGSWPRESYVRQSTKAQSAPQRSQSFPPPSNTFPTAAVTSSAHRQCCRTHNQYRLLETLRWFCSRTQASRESCFDIQSDSIGAASLAPDQDSWDQCPTLYI